MNVFAKSAVCVMLLAVGSAFAQAKKANDDGSYAEVSYIRWNFKSDASSQSINPTGLRAIYGFGGGGLAYEAHLALPLAAGSFTTVAGDDPDVPASVKVDTKITSLGLFAKLYTKASDDLELYGRLGMSSMSSTVDLTATSTTGKASDKLADKSTSFGYGVGVKYKVGSSTSVVFDYTGYSKNSLSALGLGVAFAF